MIYTLWPVLVRAVAQPDTQPTAPYWFPWAIIVLLIVAGFWAYWRSRALPPGNRRSGEQRITALENTVEMLLSDRVADRAKIEELTRLLAIANEHIRQLEALLATSEARLSTSQADNAALSEQAQTRPVRPLLLVIGDERFGRTDQLSIQRTRIPFFRLLNCTRQALDDKLNEVRQDDSLYWWVHISADMGPDGIQLADGIVNAEWLSVRLMGVKVVLLAGCISSGMANALVGVVDHVIFFSEKVNDGDAGRFSFSFWNAMASGKCVADAFRDALTDVPQVAPFVDLRSR